VNYQDVHMLLQAGVLRKDDEGRIAFPYAAVHVGFMLKPVGVGSALGARIVTMTRRWTDHQSIGCFPALGRSRAAGPGPAARRRLVSVSSRLDANIRVWRSSVGASHLQSPEERSDEGRQRLPVRTFA
jgi:hypothetical protein